MRTANRATPYPVQNRISKLTPVLPRIAYKGEKIYLGTFKTDLDAACAYDRAAVLFHGRFARLNFPEEWVTGQWEPVDHDPQTDS